MIAIVGLGSLWLRNAYDTRSDAYLAWAGFEPAASAPSQVGLAMQDGGYRTAFRELPGQPWQEFNICDNAEFNAFIGGHYGGNC